MIGLPDGHVVQTRFGILATDRDTPVDHGGTVFDTDVQGRHQGAFDGVGVTGFALA